MKLFFYSIIGAMMLWFIDIDSMAQTEPSWTEGYPNIVHGASSVDFHVSLDTIGTIYYGIYSAERLGFFPAELKSDVQNGAILAVRLGSAAVGIDQEIVITESNLNDDSTYYVYVAAESAAEVLMATDDMYQEELVLPKRLQELTDFTNTRIAGYGIYFPESYFRDTVDYPIMIFAHGSQEAAGANVAVFDSLTRTGLPYVINNGKELPIVAVCPQAKYSLTGGATELNEFVDYMISEYRVNEDRMFFTGLGAGGTAIFDYADAYPERVAAFIPVSTWSTDSAEAHLSTFESFPTLAFMGDEERGSLYNFVADLQALHADASYVEYDGGHDSSVWNPVYSGAQGDDIYAWALDVSAPPEPPVVFAGADKEVTLPISSVTLYGLAYDLDGTIIGVGWEKVSGPDVTITANVSNSAITLTNLQAGTYVFSFFAVDDDDTTVADEMTLTVNPDPSTIRAYYINITWPFNLQGGIWNDFQTTDGGPVGYSLSLVDTSGNSSDISLAVQSLFAHYKNNHGNSSGVFPENVMKYFLRSDPDTLGSLTLSGMDTANTFDIAVLCNTYDDYYPTDTKITIGGLSKQIDATDNQEMLVFSALSPDTTGELTILVEPATTDPDNDGMINAILIREHLANALSARLVSSPSPETKLDRQVLLYPNPMEDYLTVVITPEANQDLEGDVTLYNAQGVALTNQSYQNVGSDNAVEKTLYTGSMKPGLYILHVRQGTRVRQFKVVKR